MSKTTRRGRSAPARALRHTDHRGAAERAKGIDGGRHDAGKRHLSGPGRFRGGRQAQARRLRAPLRRIAARSAGVLGQGRRAPRLDAQADPGQGRQLRARRFPHPLVRRRRTQRQRQLPRPASGRARRQDRAAVRAGRPGAARAAHQLSRTACARVPARQRLAQPRRAQGRPHHHLPADDPGRGRGDARLRAHRRGAFGGVRRLRAAVDRRSRRRLPEQAHHHRRRGPARRQEDRR